MDVLITIQWWDSFHNVCIYWIIVLYTLDILINICQLHINNAGEKKKGNPNPECDGIRR